MYQIKSRHSKATKEGFFHTEESYIDFIVPTIVPKFPLPLRALLDINYRWAGLLEERGPGG